ncbi:MAG: MopE-related protein, partial [bacterium]
MRRLFWICACALALTGCPDDGGGGGGTGGEGDSTTGNIDSGATDTGRPDRGATDSTAPPVDMGLPEDQGVPPADMAVPPVDMAVPPADMAVPPVDMGPECTVGESRACPGECAGGTQACVDGAWAPCVFPEESCNGTDDDCDGNTDEDFAGLGEACQAGVGACQTAGEVVCAADGTEAICNAVAGAPAAEICDGIDNNCDGSVDEDVSEPCYDGPEGTEGVGACLGGRRICADGAFGACMGAVLPGDERCNAADDDCDGTIDESFGGGALVEACYEGPAGSQDVGICRGGQRLCQAGAFGPCAEQVLPGQEICDLVDNDCNGAVDDRPGGCECIPGDEQACYSGAAGTAGVGVCQEGRQICNANGRFGACEGEVVPQAELCDGADNDCDGEIDNDVAGAGQDCAAGVGACRAAGQTVCNAELGEVACDARPGQPVAERCNQTDDDCDGRTDESLGLGDACSVGVGACAANGVQICGPNGAVACSAQPGQGRPELCNNIDDDCDGRVDEGFEGVGMPCSAGSGGCTRDGVRVCDADGALACSAQPGDPVAETCGDGRDDDCDGTVDEGFDTLGMPCEAGLGVCLRAGTLVCAAGRMTCDAQPPAPGEEQCDGLDDDCDGAIDESCP